MNAFKTSLEISQEPSRGGRSGVAVMLAAMAVAFASLPIVNAQPIELATTVTEFSSGGVTLRADELHRLARGGDPRGAGGQALLVACDGAFGYSTIQSAIDDAADGDVVVVFPNDCTPEGRWYENINFMGKDITVQSTHPADETVVAATIIDGGQVGSVVRLENGETLDAVLDGLTITNGRGVGSQINGGGVTCVTASATIRRCVLRDNESNLGGGIYAFQSDGVSVEDCTLVENHTTATVYSHNSQGLRFTGCRFEQANGSAVRLFYSGPVTCVAPNYCAEFSACTFTGVTGDDVVVGRSLSFAGCSFVNNTGRCVVGTDLLMTDCSFTGNTMGSPIYLFGGDALIERTEFINNSVHSADLVSMGGGSHSIRDCVFQGNSSTSDGIVGVSGQVDITDTEFRENTARSSIVYITVEQASTIDRCQFVDNHGDICGAMLITDPPTSQRAIIRNSVFMGNSALTGPGAILANYSIIADCLFVGNVTQSHGGAISSYRVSVNGCTIVGNRARGLAGGIYRGDVTNSILYDNRDAVGDTQRSQLSSGIVTFSNIQNLETNLAPQGLTNATAGNFDRPPQFVDPGAWDDMGTPMDYSDDVYTLGDYHLQPDSPCIDAGDPKFESDVANPMDFDGEPRVQSCRIDMGADEFTQDNVVTIGDFDGDGDVTVEDVPAFLEIVLNPVGLGVCLADVNGDGYADGLDVAAMVGALLGP